MFVILPISYLVSGLIVQCLPQSVDSRVFLIYTCFLNFISLLLIGPSKVLEFPDKAWLIGIGQFTCGNAVAWMNVLSLPEMMR
jgi:hypothetical protein